uniref:Uncharacterized protein n=1 Tax=Arundo donax TaxID=35708 RepID=A0A0A9GF10_ARUDO
MGISSSVFSFSLFQHHQKYFKNFSSEISTPSSRNLSLTSIKCGDVKSPVWKPHDRRIDSVNVHVEPFPLVPAT